MYKYVFKNGTTEIKTPFATNQFDSIEKEIIKTEDCITTKLIYPNGFFVESKTFSDRIEYTTSHELIDNGDGTFSVNI